jgi:hypothetical protein
MPEGEKDSVWSAVAGSHRSRLTGNRHAPRMRGIQYAAAPRFYHVRLWNSGSPEYPNLSLRGALATKQSILSSFGNMDCFATLAMTNKRSFSISWRDAPEVCWKFHAL